MAYNPAMYYGNMYGNAYTAPYGQTYPSPQTVQPSQMSYAQSSQLQGIIWVDGEVGAKAYQMPPGWPVNTPMPLWDTNDTIIYLKSTNQMGMPNPLQKIHYKMDEPSQPSNAVETPRLASGDARPDLSGYVRREDLDAVRDELRTAIQDLQQAEQKGAARNAKSSV